MIRLAAILIGLSCILSDAVAQGEDNSLKDVPFKERVVFGGGFGLSFGNTQDFVSVSPQVGYMLTKKLVVGTGFTYRYTNFKVVKPSIKLHDYGVNPFVRFIVYKNFYLQGEYEYLNYEFPVTVFETTRKSFSSVLGGGGFIQPISNRVALYFMALYNFSYQTPGPGEYTPYSSPLVIRAGISVGNFGF
jgi:hypothetical protein